MKLITLKTANFIPLFYLIRRKVIQKDVQRCPLEGHILVTVLHKINVYRDISNYFCLYFHPLKFLPTFPNTKKQTHKTFFFNEDTSFSSSYSLKGKLYVFKQKHCVRFKQLNLLLAKKCFF